MAQSKQQAVTTVKEKGKPVTTSSISVEMVIVGGILTPDQARLDPGVVNR